MALFDHYDLHGLPVSCEEVERAMTVMRGLLHHANAELSSAVAALRALVPDATATDAAGLVQAVSERIAALTSQRDRLRNKLIPKGFGRWNQHCMSCGDERGGPFGHETSECRYKPGMTAGEVAELLPEHRRAEFWELCVERYLTLELETRGEALAADAHPERTCGRCGGPNITWAAPSPLWNQVMRGGDINGTEVHDGIVCPTCFALLAQSQGVAEVWRLYAERVHVPLQTVTPSGRVWDAEAWLWVDPPQPTGAISVECPTCGSGPGQPCIHQPTGDIRLPWHEERYRAADAPAAADEEKRVREWYAAIPTSGDEEEAVDRLAQALTSDMLAPNVRTAITTLLGDGVTVTPALRQRLLSAAERGRLERRAKKAADAPAIDATLGQPTNTTSAPKAPAAATEESGPDRYCDGKGCIYDGERHWCDGGCPPPPAPAAVSVDAGEPANPDTQARTEEAC